MEITNYIKDAAEEILNSGIVAALPAQLAGTQFYLASAEDTTILAHGAIKGPDGTEYKIGTKQ
jgi:hypothetical protein